MYKFWQRLNTILKIRIYLVTKKAAFKLKAAPNVHFTCLLFLYALLDASYVPYDFPYGFL